LTQEGRFREDLLYRLRVVPLRIPPLRERADDIPLLAQQFARQLAAGWGRGGIALAPDALAALAARAWPGNVRELRNVVERAVILARGDVIEAADVAEEPPAPGAVGPGAAGWALPPAGLKVEDLIDDLVRQALQRASGNQSAAARLLGLSRDQVRYRMQKLGLLPGTEAESA
jgi:DNA-binding NtrC family response regulator